MPLLLALAVITASHPERPTSMSLSFGFEPRFGSYAALDDTLRAHGYAPVGSVFLPTWGLRGRAFFTPSIFAELSMGYGLRIAPGNPAPTTSTLTETSVGLGYHFGLGFFASLDAGFAVLTQTVSSGIDGGALVYMGPSLHPRVGWLIQFTKPWGQFLAVTAGFNLHLPLGAAHTNPLWEEPFSRATISTFTVGLELGLGSAGVP